MLLNDNQYFYVYLYWGKCPLGHVRPPLANHYTKKKFKFFILFFHFRCILLQISHKKCFLCRVHTTSSL